MANCVLSLLIIYVLFGMPSLRCSFSKSLKLATRACDIFWLVPGVRGSNPQPPMGISVTHIDSDVNHNDPG